jgi:hypothetical protein
MCHYGTSLEETLKFCVSEWHNLDDFKTKFTRYGHIATVSALIIHSSKRRNRPATQNNAICRYTSTVSQRITTLNSHLTQLKRCSVSRES